MNRRTFLQATAAAAITSPLLAALKQEQLDQAADILNRSVAGGQVSTAVLYVEQRDNTFVRAFGNANDEHAMFVLGSISKPINMTALMSLYDRGLFRLDDPLKKYIPSFTGDGRDAVTIKHLLTHVSGLPDQLPENNDLRKSHAPLSTFVEHATRTPLHFAPGSRYQYSSMGILLASRVAELLSGTDILTLTDRTVFKPLGMQRSAQGLGRFKLEDMVPMQTDRAAPESGGGDPTAKQWDWNSPYWRKLGAPWGGTHASAPDVARWLTEFLEARGQAVKPETARLMITNHNPPGFTSRGLAFVVGGDFAGAGCSEKTFGHTGSTGTIAWADPATKTICVVLTSLPARAIQPHPRDQVSTAIAAAQ
jgi:CubicO group peptidase (beta-lactamase class C family)